MHHVWLQELCGRKIIVARPTGYQPPAGAAELEAAAAALANPAALAQLQAGGGAAGEAGASDVVPTRRVRLSNLFTAGIMADEKEMTECLEDVKGECETFGRVASCVVVRAGQELPAGCTEADVGMCFVVYEDVSAAAKAVAALHGRDFDGNTVTATYVPEEEAAAATATAAAAGAEGAEA